MPTRPLRRSPKFSSRERLAEGITNMAWDFETDPEFEEKLRWMRSFIDSELIPLEPVMRELPRAEWSLVKSHLQDQVKAQGLWGAFLDPKLGGAGFGQLKLALMSEIIGRCMFSMTIFGVQAPDSGNMELLAHGANEAQKARWLWPNMRGEISSAFALTEPFHAGADPTVISTTATRDGDEWVINGHKWFITNASVADIVLVFVETNPESRPHKHASIIVVPSGTPGMEIVRINGVPASEIVARMAPRVSRDGFITTVRDKRLAASFRNLYWTYVDQTSRFDVEASDANGGNVSRATARESSVKRRRWPTIVRKGTKITLCAGWACDNARVHARSRSG